MRKNILRSVAVVGMVVLTGRAAAQLTNFVVLNPLPATKLESFETNTGVVIIKGSTDLGGISSDAGDVGVRCRELTDTSTGQKEQGLSLEITPRNQARTVLQIDYDEIGPLVGAIDYITKLEVTVTPLNSFDAAYTTRGGFRIAALGTRRTGMVQFGVRDMRDAGTPVVFSRDEMTRLAALINQGRATLDSIRR
jgi:hypothetical protein